jgi:hypothetical protein
MRLATNCRQRRILFGCLSSSIISAFFPVLAALIMPPEGYDWFFDMSNLYPMVNRIIPNIRYSQFNGLLPKSDFSY